MEKFLLTAAALTLAGAASAQEVPEGADEEGPVAIVGGATTVDVTAPLGDLGLAAAPFGSATADGGAFTFPITGGQTGMDGLLVEHEGSGVTLSALADPSIAVTVGNFVIDLTIDTPEGGLFGDVIGGAEGLPLFDFGEATEAGLPLFVSGTLAGALSDVFGAPDLTGAEFGVAATAPVFESAAAPAPIPVPASLPLLAASLIGLGLVARRRA